MSRIRQSDYMHWAKNQPPVRYNLGSSEVAHVRLDQLPIAIADLELDGASRHRYPPLRQAIADKEGVSPDCVVMADGTSMANMLALATLVDPGDEILAEAPAYEPMVATARFLGAEIRTFERRPEEGFRLDPEAVAAATTARTRLILISNQHNPSGAFADEAALAEIGAIGPLVLVDEVYRDAVPGSRTAALLGPRFVVTSSLTKVHGLSGLRCGWILAEPELAERMWRLNELFGVAQAHADERLACIALAHLERLGTETPALLARNRQIAADFLAVRDEIDWTPTPHGITLFPRLRSGDVEALHARLVSAYDTSIVPGRWFGRPDHFRLGIGAPTPLLEAGLERLGRALDETR